LGFERTSVKIFQTGYSDPSKYPVSAQKKGRSLFICARFKVPASTLHKTQTKRRARGGASPSASSYELKICRFLKRTMTTLTLNFIFDFLYLLFHSPLQKRQLFYIKNGS
jgi:hypothetical protein